MKYRDRLKKQIIDSGANVVFTYIAHWIIINRLKKSYRKNKLWQIALMSFSTTGFVTSLVAEISWLGWAGSLVSAIALMLNLYMLNFNVVDEIKQHTDAANELWYARELYKSLLTDFDVLSDSEIREKRNKLIEVVNQINKGYLGTDEESFKEAQKKIGEYKFDDGESENIMNIRSDAQ